LVEYKSNISINILFKIFNLSIYLWVSQITPNASGIKEVKKRRE
jgi:hypothetical protein